MNKHNILIILGGILLLFVVGAIAQVSLDNSNPIITEICVEDKKLEHDFEKCVVEVTKRECNSIKSINDSCIDVITYENDYCITNIRDYTICRKVIGLNISGEKLMYNDKIKCSYDSLGFECDYCGGDGNCDGIIQSGESTALKVVFKENVDWKDTVTTDKDMSSAETITLDNIIKNE